MTGDEGEEEDEEAARAGSSSGRWPNQQLGASSAHDGMGRAGGGMLICLRRGTCSGTAGPKWHQAGTVAVSTASSSTSVRARADGTFVSWRRLRNRASRQAN